MIFSSDPEQGNTSLVPGKALKQSGKNSLVEAELLEYCPNSNLYLWMRPVLNWLPFFWLAVVFLIVIGHSTGMLKPCLIFLAGAFIIPLKPFLSGQAGGGFLIEAVKPFAGPVYLLLGGTVCFFSVRAVLRPTHLALRHDCIFVGRRSLREEGWVIDRLLQWQDVATIELRRPKGKSGVSDYIIEFFDRRYHCGQKNDGPYLTIRYGDLTIPAQRFRLIQSIKRYARANAVSRELLDVFDEPEIRQSYTQLWLKELSAAPRRDKLTPLSAGARLQDGAYIIEEKIGIGGQGTVYLSKCFIEGACCSVALKEFLLPVFPDQRVRRKAAERFQAEAAVLAKLNHPQIVKFIDLFVEDHRAYLVLEKAEGVNLKAYVKQHGPFCEAQVKELALEMCNMLEYLHGLSPPVIHRDFTPDNLMLSPDGTLKLIDFSVAQQVEPGITGSVVGKPSYVSPEQFRGKPTPQSDIYSLGATLSFLLTGSEPKAVSVSEPRKLNASISELMNSIVVRCTQIEVSERYDSVQELRDDLLRLEHEGVGATAEKLAKFPRADA